MLPEENSQYVPDSFIVVEADENISEENQSAEVSMCPLERAEKILKERKKAKRLLAKAEMKLITSPSTSKHRKRRKINRVMDSSDEE